jgi:hypothetical protein
VRVHVTLKRSVASDPAARQDALARVLAAGHMSLANVPRFERHGIITGETTGELSPLPLDRLRGVSGVDAVEVDDDEPAGLG